LAQKLNKRLRSQRALRFHNEAARLAFRLKIVRTEHIQEFFHMAKPNHDTPKFRITRLEERVVPTAFWWMADAYADCDTDYNDDCDDDYGQDDDDCDDDNGSMKGSSKGSGKKSGKGSSKSSGKKSGKGSSKNHRRGRKH